MRPLPHRRPFIGLPLTLAFSFATVGAQTPPVQPSSQPAVTLVEPAPPLLAKQFGAWQQALPAAAPDPGQALDQSADPSLDAILKEDGLARSAKSTYTRPASTETIDLQAFQFVDATGAFSAYTYFRKPEDRPVTASTLGTAAVQHGDSVLIWNGTTVVLAQFHGGRRIADLADLVATLPKIGGPKGNPPLLPALLPTTGPQPESLKYALGPESYHAMGGVLPADLVGFDKSAEAVTATYSGRRVLTALLYPTPQIAGDHGRDIEAVMARQGSAAGTVKLRREGELMLLTTGAWSAADAQRAIDDIHLRTQLTWNKPIVPEFHAEVRKTATLLVSILELSGLLMLAAIVLGLFFGGGRAALRVLQGKPAATEPEFLRIDLRDRPGETGRAKPLH